MDAIQFEHHAKADPLLVALLRQAAEDSGVEVSGQPQIYVTGLEPLYIMAAYALWRWAKDTLDYRRRNLELDSAQQQAALITQLIEEDGWPPEQARAIVPALLKSIADRSESDPLLKPALDKALALVGQGN